MKDKVVSVLVFSYNNGLEVRVTRAYSFNSRPTRINVYHAKYGKLGHRLAELAGRLNTLVLHKMVDEVRVINPTA